MPPDPLNSWIFPSGPTGTTTRFGMLCPAWKFRFEVCCLVAPEGHTVTYPADGRGDRGHVHHDRGHPAGRDPALDR